MRVQLKAVRYAKSFPGTVIIPMRQVSRWAEPQPFDLLVLRPFAWPRLVEVRANQWRTGKASTVDLAQLPGISYHKQIWKFDDGETTPQIRQWQHEQWMHLDNPWDGVE